MRKNFILTMLMFLFINILSIANENLPAVNTNINNMNPAYDESLKEYKIQVENTEKLYNYIEKTIKENSITTVFTKLENSNLVASDENDNIIFIEKLPENLSKIEITSISLLFSFAKPKILMNKNKNVTKIKFFLINPPKIF